MSDDSITAAEAAASFATLIARVRKGEPVTITEDGIPCARLVPVDFSAGKRRFNLFGRTLDIPDDLFLTPMTEEELSDWEDGPIFPPEPDETP